MLTAIGRSWTIQELREKSWDDLHSLWWVCMKERNRIATSNAERDRLKAGYGLWEAENRDRTVGILLILSITKLYPCSDVLFVLGHKNSEGDQTRPP